MKTTEIQWDLAPEGATELRDTGKGLIRWFNCRGERYINNQWCTESSVDFTITLATRPQQKTVADAYEWANGEWHGYGRNVIAYNPNSDFFSYFVAGSVETENWQPICTRQQFEAYAEEQEAKITMDDINEHISTGEQEGEKWTHRTNAGELCNIHVKEPDVNGVIIVINERGEYLRHNSDSLKPIKPKLTKAEAWDKYTKEGLNPDWISVKYDIV